jgi:hypothetical protein
MSLFSWITSNPDAVAFVGGTIASWLGLKRADKISAQARASLTAALRAEAYRVLGDPSRHANARDHLTGALRAAAARLRIPARVADALAPVLVEEALASFWQLLIERQLDAIAHDAALVAATLKEANR